MIEGRMNQVGSRLAQKQQFRDDLDEIVNYKLSLRISTELPELLARKLKISDAI